VLILVIGQGAREHAITHTLLQDSKIEVVCAPGNPGISNIAQVDAVDIADVTSVVALAKKHKPDLVVIGPEAPLVAGVADELRNAGFVVFGPSKAAAALEGSKAFAKEIMQAAGVPTADSKYCQTVPEARVALELFGAPYVVKDDGLAAGKGVVVAMNLDEAHAAVDMMLADNKFGNAGARVVIEEFLTGEEASFIVLVDGKNALALATSQDHKRLLNGDQGPNTGGMGAYSPAPVVTPEIHAKAMREVIMPTIQGMKADGIPYTGFLYAGLMISPEGQIKTLEFNCRMGDPETQPIMARLRSDLVHALDKAVDGKLNEVELEWDRRTALGVVLAAYQYPDTPRKGDAIIGIPEDTASAITFHAGTTMADGTFRTNGGRVLCVVGLADTVRGAQKEAYQVIEQIHFDGMQYRQDIGHRALK
jgi:phosphoribosylamine--glycine ligase